MWPLINTALSYLPQKKSLRIGSLVIVLFILIIGGYKLFSYLMAPNPPQEIKVVEVEEVALHDISQTVRLIGTIQAKHSTVLIAKASGYLEHIAHAGEKVLKDGLIAKLDNMDIEKNYQLSESAEKIAKNQFDRRTQLQKGNISSKKDLEDSRNVWIDAQKSLSIAKIEYDKTKFIAPFDGLVGVYKIREGTQVQIGDTIGTFYDPLELIVEFDIPAPILKQLSTTSTIKVNNQTLPVLHIQKMLDPDSHMSPAYVDYPCPNDCIIGTTVDLDLSVSERKGVVVIPYEAVFLRNGNQFVYIVKEGKAILSPVILGIREKDRVEITSGIAIGDLVIIRGQTRLSPDLEVKIFDPGKKQIP